ncbi:protein of unknown function (plasmid) [Methylocella tundrae]|uniref:Uncharacterized protein n=1 Tax=Methylocella tundrae TaxID=227605 RepID=A0A4U8Z6P8_METTU|nr:protein of unknown function [Methylocella tundrae]
MICRQAAHTERGRVRPRDCWRSAARPWCKVAFLKIRAGEMTAALDCRICLGIDGCSRRMISI